MSNVVIFNGESGTGKTENAKQLLKYIYKCTENDDYSQHMMSLGSVLEFFGNSTTMQNVNSSRFSKFVQV